MAPRKKKIPITANKKGKQDNADDKDNEVEKNPKKRKLSQTSQMI